MGCCSAGSAGLSTERVKLWVAERLGTPLSVTTTPRALVDGLCESNGRHSKAPLVGLSAAFVGPFRRVKVRVCGGASVSEAELVKVMVVPATTVRFEIAARVGGVLGALVVVTRTPTLTGPKVMEVAGSVALKVKPARPL